MSSGTFKRIYFVRHGETDNNVMLIRPDHTPPLNKKGREQADLIAQRLKNIDIDVILSSDMVRATETAEIIAKHLGKVYEPSHLFKERLLPSESVGKHANDPELLAIDAQIIANQSDPDWRYSDEENFDDVRNRARQAIKHLEERDEKNIVVVTHSMYLRYLIATMLDPNIDAIMFRKWFLFTKMHNAGVTICQQDPEDNLHAGWRMDAWNDYGHLSE